MTSLNKSDGVIHIESATYKSIAPFVALEKENKELKTKMSGLRVKVGVATANYNVGKHETDDLRKSHQENQIHIARWENSLS